MASSSPLSATLLNVLRPNDALWIPEVCESGGEALPACCPGLKEQLIPASVFRIISSCDGSWSMKASFSFLMRSEPKISSGLLVRIFFNKFFNEPGEILVEIFILGGRNSKVIRITAA